MKKVTLENMIERLNVKNGVTAPKWNTIGSYKLYKDGAGYAVHKVINAGGGLESLSKPGTSLRLRVLSSTVVPCTISKESRDTSTA